MLDVGPDEFPLYTKESSGSIKTSDIPQGSGSNLDSDTVDGFQAARSGPNKLIVSDQNGNLPSAVSPTGSVIQTVYNFSGSLASGTTTIPYDDTIPQNTEGNEFLTLSITPTSATSILEVETLVHLGTNAANRMIAAIFRDSTASAISVGMNGIVSVSDSIVGVLVKAKVTANSTSTTTFKVRAGGNNAGTIYFNGDGTGSRRFGALFGSYIKISEIKA